MHVFTQIILSPETLFCLGGFYSVPQFQAASCSTLRKNINCDEGANYEIHFELCTYKNKDLCPLLCVSVCLR